MKLETKQIAHYFPYRLNMFHTSLNEIFLLDTMELDINSDAFYGQLAKPILRPMADLTKEIEHNGEMIVPIHFLTKIGYENRNKSDFEFYSKKYDYFAIVLNLEIYNLLLEWHFDVFGLIEKGFAVNINTIKQ